MENTATDLVMDALLAALLDGDQSRSVEEAKRLRDAGVESGKIITDGVEAAMSQLDAKCTVEQFNLLEIMLSGRAVMGVMRELYPGNTAVLPTKGAVVLGSLEGDVHDLGKNILKTILTVSGFRVVDCGKDCPLEKMIDAAEQESAIAIGVSGLITTVLPQLRRLRERVAERGMGRVKVIAGGAALKQSTAESLQVDFIAQNAFDGLHYLEEIAGGAK